MSDFWEYLRIGFIIGAGILSILMLAAEVIGFIAIVLYSCVTLNPLYLLLIIPLTILAGITTSVFIWATETEI